MATTEDLDASPLTIMAAMRGTLARASIAYPEVLHLDIHDGEGRRWRFSTQDADYDPADPADLHGRWVEDLSMLPHRY